MEQNQASMTPVDIKVALLRANVTQAAIAREIGVSQVSVLRVIKNHSASHRIRLAIAKAIDRDVRQIWPEAGKKRGRPKSYMDKAKLETLIKSWKTHADRHEKAQKRHTDPLVKNKHLAHKLTYRTCAKLLREAISSDGSTRLDQ